MQQMPGLMAPLPSSVAQSFGGACEKEFSGHTRLTALLKDHVAQQECLLLLLFQKRLSVLDCISPAPWATGILHKQLCWVPSRGHLGGLTDCRGPAPGEGQELGGAGEQYLACDYLP